MMIDPLSSRPLFRGRRTLVLGASGFIGRVVACELTVAGADVILAGRQAVPGFPAEQQILVDLFPAGSAAELIERTMPAVVFNLAGYGVDRFSRDPGIAQRINAEMPGEAATAAVKFAGDGWNGLRFVHVGSALEYGVATGDLDEQSEPLPTTLYGTTKLAGTRAVTEAGPLCLTARLFMVYGPGEKEGRLLPSLIEAAHSGRHLPLTDGLQERDFTFVGDVAEGLLRLASLPPPSLFEPVVNLATGELRTVKHFVQEAARVLGLRHDQLGFGELVTRAEEMTHLPVAIHRLRRRTGGWIPRTPIAQGIEKTLEVERATAPAATAAG